MTNLEAIKEDYKIGDPIRITCRFGVKEGYIVDFSESRIKLRSFDEERKPISISEDSIFDFEDVSMDEKYTHRKVVDNSEKNRWTRKLLFPGE